MNKEEQIKRELFKINPAPLHIINEGVYPIINWYENQRKQDYEYYKILENEIKELKSQKISPVNNENDVKKNYEIDLSLLEKEKSLREFKKKYDGFKLDIESCIISDLNSKAGLRIVPGKYREKVISLAWERGHSGGYSDYYDNLSSLIGIFED